LVIQLIIENQVEEMKEMSKEQSGQEYTSLEMMSVAAARQVKDHELVFVGTGLPMLASMLALHTHAPQAVILYEAGYLGCRNIDTARVVGDIRLMYNLAQVTTMMDVLGLLQSGRVDVGFLGGAQIDKYGNINATTIGDYGHPKVRLPGAGGAVDIAAHARRIVIIVNHEKRRFPEKVDYISSPGWLGGPKDRETAGLRWGGPAKVITDLAILGFDDLTKRMKLESLHPGVTVDKVKEETGFELLIPDRVLRTAPPTSEDVRILREVVGFFLKRRMRG
jgi:acyl CoA:acetate/3-ketoacid CoA transferase beta subunit